MKAIHNLTAVLMLLRYVVYDPAKLVKMKAIHNGVTSTHYDPNVVYDPAKLVKMKAIHNVIPDRDSYSVLFMTLQS